MQNEESMLIFVAERVKKCKKEVWLTEIYKFEQVSDSVFFEKQVANEVHLGEGQHDTTLVFDRLSVHIYSEGVEVFPDPVY